MTEPLLATNQLTVIPSFNLFGLTRSMDLVDSAGHSLGMIVRTGFGVATLADETEVLGTFRRPPVLMRSRVTVLNAKGATLGEVRQTTFVGGLAYEVQDANGEFASVVQPGGLGAFEFVAEDVHGHRLAKLTRRYRFSRTGDFSLSMTDGLGPEHHLLVIGIVVAVDASIRRRRRGGAPGPIASG